MRQINLFLSKHPKTDPGHFSLKFPTVNDNYIPNWSEGYRGQGKLTETLKPFIDYGSIEIHPEFIDDEYYDDNSCPRRIRDSKKKRLIYNIVKDGSLPDEAKFSIIRDPIFFRSKISVPDNNLTCQVLHNDIHCTLKENSTTSKTLYKIIEENEDDGFLRNDVLNPQIFSIRENKEYFIAALNHNVKKIPVLNNDSLNGTVVTKFAGDPKPYLCGLKANNLSVDIKKECRAFVGKDLPKAGAEVTYVRALNKTYLVEGKKIDHLVSIWEKVSEEKFRFLLFGCYSFSSECPILVNNTPDSQLGYKIRYISELAHDPDGKFSYFYLTYERRPGTEERQMFFEFKLENGKITAMPRAIGTDWRGGFWMNDILTVEGKARLNDNKDYLQISATFRGWGWITEATQVFYCQITRNSNVNNGSTNCSKFGGNIRPPYNWNDNAKIVHVPGDTSAMFVFERLNYSYCAAKYTSAVIIQDYYAPFPKMVGNYYKCDGYIYDIVPLDDNIVFAVNNTNEVYSMRNDRTIGTKVKFDKKIGFGSPYWPGTTFYVNK